MEKIKNWINTNKFKILGNFASFLILCLVGTILVNFTTNLGVMAIVGLINGLFVFSPLATLITNALED